MAGELGAERGPTLSSGITGLEPAGMFHEHRRCHTRRHATQIYPIGQDDRQFTVLAPDCSLDGIQDISSGGMLPAGSPHQSSHHPAAG